MMNPPGVFFTVQIKPQAWARPAQRGRQRFELQHVRRYKARINGEALLAFRGAGVEPMEGPVRLSIGCYFKVPQRGGQERLGKPHAIKPDGDNLAKAIKDALKGVAFLDDAQVAETIIIKKWGPEDRVTVFVRSMA